MYGGFVAGCKENSSQDLKSVYLNNMQETQGLVSRMDLTGGGGSHDSTQISSMARTTQFNFSESK